MIMMQTNDVEREDPINDDICYLLILSFALQVHDVKKMFVVSFSKSAIGNSESSSFGC